MQQLRVAANVSFLFKDLPFLERLDRAAAWGFRFVEAMSLESSSLADVESRCRSRRLQFALLNSPPCQPPSLLGLSIFGDRVDEFDSHLSTLVDQCRQLRCPIAHITAGVIQPGVDRYQCRRTYVQNLRRAVERLRPHGVTCVVEPISEAGLPNYFLNTFEEAMEVIEEVDGLKLLLDVYHLRVIEGSLDSLPKYLRLAGHVQISQAPTRAEPGSEGLIDYDCVLSQLAEFGYSGCVGLEYKPSDGREAGLEWCVDRGLIEGLK